MVNQVIMRKVEVCKTCGAKDSFRKRNVNGEVSYAKCNQCGQLAIIRKYLPESGKSK